jgi:hypothetical protein
MIARRTLLISAPALALCAPAWARAAQAAPVEVTLYKSPDCGCCDGYADYLRRHGFAVTTVPTAELAEIGRKAGVPVELQGCHTSKVGGYVVEGHVPVEAIKKLLADRPAIKGIALPGMPLGSPGMSGAKSEPFTVHAIGSDGEHGIFMRV